MIVMIVTIIVDLAHLCFKNVSLNVFFFHYSHFCKLNDHIWLSCSQKDQIEIRKTYTIKSSFTSNLIIH